MSMYETLWRSETPEICPGCPLVLDMHALSRDLVKRELLLQYKLHNNSSRRVCGAELEVACFDEAGDALPGCECFTLSGYDLAAGQSVGELTPIPLPDARTRKVAVIPLKVQFADGTAWENPDAAAGFVAIDPQQTPLDSLGPLQAAYERELAALGVTRQHSFLPKTGPAYNLCGCGAVMTESGLCPQCGARLDELQELADPQTLNARQHRQQRESRQKKGFRRILWLVAAALVLVVGLFVLQMFQPQLQQQQDYRTARAALNEGDYDTAEAMLRELGDYKKSQQLLQQAYIEEARQLLEEDRLDEAAEVLAGIENEHKTAPLYYKLGLKYLLAGRLRSALDAFSRADDYKDAAQQAAEVQAEAEDEARAEAEAEAEAQDRVGRGNAGGLDLDATREQVQEYWDELVGQSDELWNEAQKGLEQLHEKGWF